MLEQSTISSKSFSVFVSKFPSIGVKILVSLARYGSLFWLSALHVRIKCSLVSSPSSHMTQVGLTSYLLNFACTAEDHSNTKYCFSVDLQLIVHKTTTLEAV